MATVFTHADETLLPFGSVLGTLLNEFARRNDPVQLRKFGLASAILGYYASYAEKWQAIEHTLSPVLEAAGFTAEEAASLKDIANRWNLGQGQPPHIVAAAIREDWSAGSRPMQHALNAAHALGYAFASLEVVQSEAQAQRAINKEIIGTARDRAVGETGINPELLMKAAKPFIAAIAPSTKTDVSDRAIGKALTAALETAGVRKPVVTLVVNQLERAARETVRDRQ